MSRWAKLLWFGVIAVALLIMAVCAYILSKPPPPAHPIPSGAPFTPQARGKG